MVYWIEFYDGHTTLTAVVTRGGDDGLKLENKEVVDFTKLQCV
jgi:hypothetical protein